MNQHSLPESPAALAAILCVLLHQDPATVDDRWTQARAKIDEVAAAYDATQRAEFYETAVRILDPDHRYGPYAGLGTPMTTELFIYEINRVDDYERTHHHVRLGRRGHCAALYLAMCLMTLYDSLTERDRVIAGHVATLYRSRQLTGADFPGFDYMAHMHATGQDTTQLDKILAKAAKFDRERDSRCTIEMRTASTGKREGV